MSVCCCFLLLLFFFWGGGGGGVVKIMCVFLLLCLSTRHNCVLLSLVLMLFYPEKFVPILIYKRPWD